MIYINMSRLKKNKIIGVLVFLIAIIGLVVSIHFYIQPGKKIKEYDSKVEANYLEPNCHINDHGNENCSPVYHFTYGGNDYSCDSKKTVKTVDEDLDTVYFMKDDPTICITSLDVKSPSWFLVGIISSCIVALIGLIFYIKYFLKTLKIHHLIKNGTLFKNVPFTKEDTDINIGENHYIRPIVEIITPNNIELHLVGEIIPSPRHADYKTVDVLIDLNNPDKYYIDYSIKVRGDAPNTIIDLIDKREIEKEMKEDSKRFYKQKKEEKWEALTDNVNMFKNKIDKMKEEQNK